MKYLEPVKIKARSIWRSVTNELARRISKMDQK